MPDNGECHPQAGAQGFDIAVTRVFKDLNSGAEIKRETFQTHYAAEPIIRCVPPPPADPAPDGTTPAGTPGTGGRRPAVRPADRRRVGPTADRPPPGGTPVASSRRSPARRDPACTLGG